MALVKVALIAVVFALIACNGKVFQCDFILFFHLINNFYSMWVIACVFAGFVLCLEPQCKNDNDCKGKVPFCRVKAICVGTTCECSMSKQQKPAKCKTTADCPFYCIPPCEKRFCDVSTGSCKCLCNKHWGFYWKFKIVRNEFK